jgi:hypothetical protein
MQQDVCVTSKFHILNCSSAFVITMKLKVKENFHMVAMLVFSFYKNVIWTKVIHEDNRLEYDILLIGNL